MEPLKPADRQAIKRRNADVTDADIDEYQRLLAKRFLTPPAAATPAASRDLLGAGPFSDDDQTRLGELRRKLFGRQ